MRYEFKTENTCSQLISFDIDGNVVTNIEFYGGCNGNLKAVMKKGVNVMNRNDQDFLVQKIRTQYTEKEHTGLDELKELDTKVKRPANVFAYTFGSISAIILYKIL